MGTPSCGSISFLYFLPNDILFYRRGKSVIKKIQMLLLAGLSLASAIGLSTWVALVFLAFIGIATFLFFFLYIDKKLVTSMVVVVILAFITASPFIIGVLNNGTGSEASPIVFQRCVNYCPSPHLLRGFLITFSKI